jgi:hypothetical protein
MPLQNRNSTGFPTPATKEGEPIETRLPEKVDNKPVFAGTRAPHRASVPDNVATSTDKLKTPFSFAFLPGGEIHGKRRHPAHPRRGWHALPAHCGRSHRARHRHLDVTLDPQFASNHRIFFTYSELVSQPVIEPYSNIAVACSPGRPCACRFARSLRCPRELCLRTRMAASGSGATAVCS